MTHPTPPQQLQDTLVDFGFHPTEVSPRKPPLEDRSILPLDVFYEVSEVLEDLVAENPRYTCQKQVPIDAIDWRISKVFATTDPGILWVTVQVHKSSIIRHSAIDSTRIPRYLGDIDCALRQIADDLITLGWSTAGLPDRKALSRLFAVGGIPRFVATSTEGSVVNYVFGCGAIVYGHQNPFLNCPEQLPISKEDCANYYVFR